MRTTEFKDTELGPIPKDWEVKRVGEIGEIVTGATPPRFDGSNWNGDFAWISARDFTEKYIENTVENVTEKGKRYCRCLPADSVLITCIASIGLNAICKVPCATNQQINAVVCHGDDPEYFYYAMAHSKGRFASLAGQTAVPIINKQQFSDFALAFPPLPEQRRIAAALGDVDKLIENLKKRVEKKKNLKRGAMQELLTGKRRLKGFTGAWAEKRLGEIGVFSKGAGISRAESGTGDLPAVRYGEIYTHHNDYVRHYISRISGEVAEKARLTKRGDILFAGSGETEEDIGKSVSVLDDGVYAGGDLIIFSSSEQTDPIFWGYLLNLPYVQRQKTLSAQGGTVVHIRAASIASIRVRYPPLPEQRAIAAVLSDMDAEIANLEAKLKKMTLLKQGMMQDLLTGKVRLA